MQQPFYVLVYVIIHAYMCIVFRYLCENDIQQSKNVHDI